VTYTNNDGRARGPPDRQQGSANPYTVIALALVTHAAPSSAVTVWEPMPRRFVNYDVHFCTGRQLDAATRPLAEAHYHSSHQGENSEGLRGKNVGPTCRFAASPEVGSGATVGTLQIEYPRVQAPGQSRKQGVQPHAAACPVVPNPRLLSYVNRLFFY
jgi:hypothetical protein